MGSFVLPALPALPLFAAAPLLLLLLKRRRQDAAKIYRLLLLLRARLRHIRTQGQRGQVQGALDHMATERLTRPPCTPRRPPAPVNLEGGTSATGNVILTTQRRAVGTAIGGRRKRDEEQEGPRRTKQPLWKREIDQSPG
ncbi:hypothetical protein T484DRAFT_1754304 [Baffinella frigidus]|nr:hypothetical protein T484DRAFT_1754304 [Cryptophyta sp. CCMP2293]